MSILGAGLITAALSLGILLVGGILAGILGPVGFLLFIVAAVVVIFVGARLSMAGWLAAEGASAMDAVRGSWEMTASRLLLIIGWSFAYAIVFAVVGGLIGIVLNLIQLIGPALSATLSAAFGFGAGVTLFRKVKGS